jgi:hypothetical protein
MASATFSKAKFSQCAPSLPSRTGRVEAPQVRLRVVFGLDAPLRPPLCFVSGSFECTDRMLNLCRDRSRRSARWQVQRHAVTIASSSSSSSSSSSGGHQQRRGRKDEAYREARAHPRRD